MREPHGQRGVEVEHGSGEAEDHDLARGIGRLGPVAGELRGEDQVFVFAQSDLVFEQLLDGRDQQQLFLPAVGDAVFGGDREAAFAGVLLTEGPQPVRLVAGSVDHRGGIGVEVLGLQQHQAAEAQAPDQPATLDKTDAGVELGAQVLWVALLAAAFEEQAVEIVDTRKDTAFLLLLDKELLDALEQLVRADDGQSVPIDRLADRLFQLVDPQALLGAGFEVGIEAQTLNLLIDAGAADAHAAAVGAGGYEDLFGRRRPLDCRALRLA